MDGASLGGRLSVKANRVFTLMRGTETRGQHVVITIVGRNRAELAAGVTWPAQPGLTKGGREGPFQVELGLLRAEILARTYGLARPLVWMERPDLWQATWGQLDTSLAAQEPLAELGDAELTDPEMHALLENLARDLDA